MAGYNRVVLIGNLTRDPDYRQLASGQALCKLGLATNRQFRNKQTGNLVQEVLYIDIDVWGAQAESCRQYLQKGRSILVEGRLKLDTWEDANGQNRSKHTVVADRVVFLTAQTDIQTQDRSEIVGARKGESQSDELEKGLLDQIDQIKKRSQAGAVKADAPADVQGTEKAKPADKFKKRVSKKKIETDPDMPPTGEVDFKDQPPFQDDLPF